MAATSFGLYVLETLIGLFRRRPASPDPAVTKAAADAIQRAQVPSVSDITKLIEAITKFTDSLTKASPALVSMIGAIFFLSIAAYSSTPSTASNKPPAGQVSQATKDQAPPK
jgi:translation initiation factor 2B subunit (eIF-2B alpha/beta/delta family)